MTGIARAILTQSQRIATTPWGTSATRRPHAVGNSRRRALCSSLALRMAGALTGRLVCEALRRLRRRPADSPASARPNPAKTAIVPRCRVVQTSGLRRIERSEKRAMDTMIARHRSPEIVRRVRRPARALPVNDNRCVPDNDPGGLARSCWREWRPRSSPDINLATIVACRPDHGVGRDLGLINRRNRLRIMIHLILGP